MVLKIPVLLSILFQIGSSVLERPWNKYEQYLKLQSVRLFQEYLRIDTSNPDNIKYALNFWSRQMKQLDIPYAIHNLAGRKVFVATVLGSKPCLPSIMLNSHMDVVTADASEWKYPPFAAHMDANGDIYARGTQDTKDVGIQYLEALRNLKRDNITLKRTVHLTLMPNEDTGTKDGMKLFVKSPAFNKSLNIGFALDEGLLSKDDSLFGTYVDRRAWQMQFVIYGAGGHGSTMPEGSAMENAYKFIKLVMDYRETQKKIQMAKNSSDFSGYTSVNINIIKGGLAANIIPSKMEVVVDMRLSTDAKVADMDAMVQSWMKAAGDTTEISYIRKVNKSGITAVNNTNPFWITMRNTLSKLGIVITPIVCPATTDMLEIRNLGIPAIGFTTKTRTIWRYHAKDEYQHVETFLKGIKIYTELIKNLGNLEVTK